MRLLPIRRLFGANRRGLVKGPATVDGTKHLLDDGTWTAVTATGIAASEAEALAGTNTTKFINPATLNTRALQGDITRKLAEGAYSDGATSGRRIEWTPGAVGAVQGMPLTLLAEWDVPASGSGTVVAFQSGSNAQPSLSVSGLGLYYNSGTELRLIQWNAYTANNRRLYWDGFSSTYAGQRVRVAAVFASPNTTTNPIIYINGVDRTSSFIPGFNGTPPNWLPNSGWSPTYLIQGRHMATGRFVPHAPILGALTASEVLNWTMTGRLPEWCEIGTGSAVSLIAAGSAISLGAADGAANGLGSGFNATSSYAAGARTGGAGAYYSVTTRTGASGDVKTGTLGSFPPGTKVRVSGWVKKSAGATVTTMFTSLRDSGGGTTVSNVANVNISETWAEFSVEYVSTGAATRWAVGFANGANGEEIHIDDLVFVVLGPIFKPVIRSGRVLPDLSGNKLHGVMTAGVIPLTDDMHGTVVQTALTANGELIDTVGIIPTDASFEDIVVRNTSANPVYGFAVAMTSGGDEITYRTDIPAGATVILPIKRADAAGLTAGTYTAQGATFGRLYYSATSWNSGSLNISVRYRRERGI